MSKKKDALSKALLRHFRCETVAVIHSAFEDSPRTVALVNVDKSWSKNKKLDKAVLAPPRCNWPVGLGANLTRGFINR